MHVVIIGNGVAGMEAALALRAAEPAVQISIVSEESDHFFSRTALMWVLCGQMSYRDIEPLERDAYARHGLNRIRDRVVSVDTDRKTLALAVGEDLAYDKLLIACGSKPRPAPWEGAHANGVGNFVTLRDLQWLEHELHGGTSRMAGPRTCPELDRIPLPGSPYARRALRERPRVTAPAVIGGGLIGIEAIECFVAAGYRPHFFIRQEWFWPMSLDARESRWIEERLADHGVFVHVDHEIKELAQRDEELCAIITDQGAFDANLCVVAIGVVPNTAWLSGAKIELDAAGGVVVDEALRTSAPDVLAAGDCASVMSPNGRRRPEQLWYTARDQGRVAAATLRGAKAHYERGVPYNSAKLMDIEYTTAGNLDVTDAQFFFEERGKVRSTTRIASKDGHVTGFNMLGRRWDHNVFIDWIENEKELSWVIDHLYEASFDTEFVPPLDIPHSARGNISPTSG